MFKVVIANPEEGIITEGDAIITQDPNTHVTKITQYSPYAIIDWQEFNIAPHEYTEFIQPSSNAITINRVKGDTISRIYGNLIANGKLVLINQNGILFDTTAAVDVGGLIATTLDFDNKKNKIDLSKNGLLVFDKFRAKINSTILNKGKITAQHGLIGLVAPEVINSGVIVAKAGKVKLASGTAFALDLYGDDLLKVTVAHELETQLLSNTGKIIADGQQIVLSAAAGQKLVNSLIVNSGALQAKSIDKQNGEIIIAAEGSNAVLDNIFSLKGIKSGESNVIISGIVDASGNSKETSGGNVQITGDSISLLENAVIDASGGNAGGEILIGGDYLGLGAIPTSTFLNVGPKVTIFNDSYYYGNAGKSIFWSDGITNFYGKVFGRSLGGKGLDPITNNVLLGGNHGNGGFVETSGRIELNVGGYVNLTASNGTLGSYLLDPNQINIRGSDDFTNSVDNSNITTAYLMESSKQADLVLEADRVVFDFQGHSINLTENRNLNVNAKNTIQAISAGTINTTSSGTGGNVTLRARLGSIDLNNLNLNVVRGKLDIVADQGPVSLGNIVAGTVEVKALGNSSNITIPQSKKITATDPNDAIILVAGGGIQNYNLINFLPFNLVHNNARWLIYHSVPSNNQGLQYPYLGDYNEEQHKNYDVTPTQKGNLLVYIPQLLGNYDNKNIDTVDTINSRTIVLENLRLAGQDAANYRLSSTRAIGNIGSILPKDLTIMPDRKTRAYQARDPTFTYSTVGLIPDETHDNILPKINATTSANFYSLPGTYSIDVSGPNIIDNYLINYVNNKLTISGKVENNQIEIVKSSPNILNVIYSNVLPNIVLFGNTSTVIVVNPISSLNYMNSTLLTNQARTNNVADNTGYDSAENNINRNNLNVSNKSNQNEQLTNLEYSEPILNKKNKNIYQDYEESVSSKKSSNIYQEYQDLTSNKIIDNVYGNNQSAPNFSMEAPKSSNIVNQNTSVISKEPSNVKSNVNDRKPSTKNNGPNKDLIIDRSSLQNSNYKTEEPKKVTSKKSKNSNDKEDE